MSAKKPTGNGRKQTSNSRKKKTAAKSGASENKIKNKRAASEKAAPAREEYIETVNISPALKPRKKEQSAERQRIPLPDPTPKRESPVSGELIGRILLIFSAIFVTICYFFPQTAGFAGGVKSLLCGLFGAAGFTFPAALLLFAFFLKSDLIHRRIGWRAGSAFGMLLFFSVFLHGFSKEEMLSSLSPSELWTSGKALQSGGAAGGLIGSLLFRGLGRAGVFAISVTALLVSALFYAAISNTKENRAAASALAKGLAAMIRGIGNVGSALAAFAKAVSEGVAAFFMFIRRLLGRDDNSPDSEMIDDNRTMILNSPFARRRPSRQADDFSDNYITPSPKAFEDAVFEHERRHAPPDALFDNDTGNTIAAVQPDPYLTSNPYADPGETPENEPVMKNPEPAYFSPAYLPYEQASPSRLRRHRDYVEVVNQSETANGGPLTIQTGPGGRIDFNPSLAEVGTPPPFVYKPHENASAPAETSEAEDGAGIPQDDWRHPHESYDSVDEYGYKVPAGYYSGYKILGQPSNLVKADEEAFRRRFGIGAPRRGIRKPAAETADSAEASAHILKDEENSAEAAENQAAASAAGADIAVKSQSEKSGEDTVIPGEILAKFKTADPDKPKETEDESELSDEDGEGEFLDEAPRDSFDVEKNRLVPLTPEKAPPPKPPYVLPPVTLLRQPEHPKNEDISEELNTTAKKLTDMLNSFKVSTRIVDISRGPTITRYELQPDEGVRVKQISNLVDDISLGLASTGVRIEAPIPGKAAVGVEVPNKVVATVFLREMIEDKEFKSEKHKLLVSLGMDVAGKPIYCNLAKMPHLLIAGATGMGKSVCINSMIMSLLYRADPDEVKLILVDPKKVELNVYNGLPHLLLPVVSEPKKAAGALQWAVNEMERRFTLIEKVGVRDLDSYNREIETNPEFKDDPDFERCPYVVIIIDELADLMMTAPDSVEESICRLAQKARAAGMHLVIGTQRPSVDVITGLIKANIPSRIAFTVSSQTDSRVILDMTGAEKLIGRGDMLYSPVGFQKPVRVQGSFVSDKEVEAVVKFIKDKSEGYSYDETIQSLVEENAQALDKDKKTAQIDDTDDDDPMLKEAIKLAVDSGKISTSLIQRRLSLGYGRAAKLIDRMQNMGIVSEPDGQKPRTVLISREQYMEMKMREDD